MKTITCIEDLRDVARRKVPKAFFDYVDSGSYNEETLRANRADLEMIKLRQRVMGDESTRPSSDRISVLHSRLRPSDCAGCSMATVKYWRRRQLKRQAFLSLCPPCPFARLSRWRRLPRGHSGFSSTSSATVTFSAIFSGRPVLPNAMRWF